MAAHKKDGSKKRSEDRLNRKDSKDGRKRKPTKEQQVVIAPTPVNDRNDVVASKYPGLRKSELIALLKQRNASLRGKKKDLLDRLVFYDLNANFQVRTTTSDEPILQDVLDLPAKESFKDIHAGSPVPSFALSDVELFLKRFNKSSDTAQRMYECGYLQYARYSISGDYCFIEGQVSAEMSKSTRYLPYAKLSSDGEVEGTQCDCTAGHTGDAHCKHVIVLLLAIADVKKTGTIVTELSCTEQLQTFHKPRGKFKGTPFKVASMQKKNPEKEKAGIQTPEQKEDKDRYYINWFKNHVINVGFNFTMPIKCINPPANPYAIEADHTYSCLSVTDSLLKSLQLEEITAEEISKIEEETRGQATNEKWHVYREGRLTASNFFQFVRGAETPTLAHNSLYPLQFVSPATNHGIKYERIAVEKYVEKYNITEDVKECGLFILESHPFIAGSPDRLLGNDGIIEVKCPYASRREEVSPANQIFLETSNDLTLELKKTHPFYYQVQGQMLVTGRAFCDMVVYTFKGCERIRVPRNESFIDLLFCDLYEFFMKYMKPAVINKYIHRDHDKCGFHDLSYCAKN